LKINSLYFVFLVTLFKSALRPSRANHKNSYASYWPYPSNVELYFATIDLNSQTVDEETYPSFLAHFTKSAYDYANQPFVFEPELISSE
jgi:hypothetical protein